MKNICFWGVIALLCASLPVLAQTTDPATWRCGATGPVSLPQPNASKESYYGFEHTPKGHLHMLVVYVEFTNNSIDYPDYDLDPNWYLVPNTAPEQQQAWVSGQIPTIAQEFGTPGQSRMFNSDLPIGGVGQLQNLSSYYYEQSNGQFLVTADVYPTPVVIPIEDVMSLNLLFDDFYDHVNRLAIDYVNQNQPSGFDWADYDNRTNHTPNNTQFLSDNSNSAPDGILDYVVFIHRRAYPLTPVGEPNAVAAAVFNGDYNIPNTNFSLTTYGGQTHCISAQMPLWNFNMDVFQHEFAHNLYASNFFSHHLGANGERGIGFRACYGWGMMSGQLSQFEVSNAWERWWMDWLTPTDVTTNGYYTLKDLATYNEAIRIPISNSGGQYLWLENHQKTNIWDGKIFFDDQSAGQPESDIGIYAMVGTAFTTDRSQGASPPNGLRVLHKEGNFDTKITGTTLYMPDAGGDQLVFSQTTRKPNPFFGFNAFESQPADYNNSGSLSHRQIFAEEIGGVDLATYAVTGNANDAFHVGDGLGLSHLVPVSPFPYYDGINQPFITLNGIRVEVVGFDPLSTAYTLHITFDNYGITDDKRWCGSIKVPDLGGASITLAPGKTLLLDKGETPTISTINPITQDFVEPSVLILENGSKWIMEDNSTIIVTANSQLILEGGSDLTLKSGAKIIVQEGGHLILKDDCHITIEGNGEIFIAEDASITCDNEQFVATPYLTLQDPDSRIYIKGQWDISQGGIFTFTGLGHLRLGLSLTNFVTGNVKMGFGSRILLQGNSISQDVLIIDDNTVFAPRNFSLSGNPLTHHQLFFEIADGSVKLGENASIWLSPLVFNTFNGLPRLRFERVHFTSILPNKKYSAILLNGQKYFLIEHCIFQNGQVGLLDIQDVPNGKPLVLKHCLFAQNNIGLFTQGLNADLETVNFVENGKGWQATATTQQGKIINSAFQNNIEQGSLIEGIGGWEVRTCLSSGNEVGIEATGNLVVEVECSNISNNSSAGIVMNKEATLDMSDVPFNTKAQNVLNDNSVTLQLNKAGKLRLNNGYNNLIPSSGGWVTQGTQALPCILSNIVTDASFNEWNVSGTSPAWGTDYEINSTYAPNFCSLYLSDPTPDAVPCGITPCEGCPSEERLYNCVGCEKILTDIRQTDGTYTPTELWLNDAVMEGINWMTRYNVTTGSDIESSKIFLKILNYDFSPLNAEEHWLLDYTYENLLQATLSGIEH